MSSNCTKQRVTRFVPERCISAIQSVFLRRTPSEEASDTIEYNTKKSLVLLTSSPFQLSMQGCQSCQGDSTEIIKNCALSKILVCSRSDHCSFWRSTSGSASRRFSSTAQTSRCRTAAELSIFSLPNPAIHGSKVRSKAVGRGV